MTGGPAPVTVVSGLDRFLVDDLVTGLVLRNDRVAVLHPERSELRDGAAITIHVHDATGRVWLRQSSLVDCCVNCTLVAGLIDVLTEFAATGAHDAFVVQLPPGVEADGTLRGLAHGLPAAVRLDTHVGVLPADWFDVLAGGSALRDHGAALGADDDRFAAPLVCSTIDTASTLVVAARPTPRAWTPADERAVLDLLAPAAVRLRLRSVLDVPDDDVLGTGRFDAALLDPLVEYGIRDPRRELGPHSSLSLVRWDARRPLHPVRLHAALDELADGVIRSSGRLDVADQPESVVGWDSAGEALLLGPIAAWPTSGSPRPSTLALLGDGLDAAHIRDVLDRCLLDDAELAIVTSDWNDVADICPAPSARAGGRDRPSREGGNAA